MNFQKEGYSKEELLAGLAQVLPKNVWQYVVQIPRLAALGTQVRPPGRHAVQPRRRQGAGRLHQGARARAPRSSSTRTRGEAGAIGAAIETLRVVKRRGTSTFIGLDAAIDLEYTTKNDEETRLPLLPERVQAHVHRHRRRPTATPAATSPASPARRAPSSPKRRCSRSIAERKKLAKQFPNLVDYEAKLAFRHFYDAGADARRRARRSKDVEVTKALPRRRAACEVDAAVPARSSAEAAGAAPPACASASRAC